MISYVSVAGTSECIAKANDDECRNAHPTVTHFGMLADGFVFTIDLNVEAFFVHGR